MDVVLRVVTILGSLGVIVILLFLNKMVIERIWAPGIAEAAVEEADWDEDWEEEFVADEDGAGEDDDARRN